MTSKIEINCYRCGETEPSSISELYGYSICNACKVQLGLMQEETIHKHRESYQRAKEVDPMKPSYLEEVNHRLAVMDKDYISKRIKLMHIRDRLKKTD